MNMGKLPTFRLARHANYSNSTLQYLATPRLHSKAFIPAPSVRPPPKALQESYRISVDLESLGKVDSQRNIPLDRVPIRNKTNTNCTNNCTDHENRRRDSKWLLSN